MIRTIIIDDEPLATQIILEYLEDFPEFEVVHICYDGFAGLKAIQEYKPDLIFLDVQMPKLNGFELLELIDNPPAIIFTTAFDAYAAKAFDVYAVDYLLKPVSKARFGQAIARFISKEKVEQREVADESTETTDRLVVKVKQEIKIIPLADVLYLEANDDFVNIVTVGGKFIKNNTLGSFEKKLDPRLFVRVHRSYIVNVSKIAKIETYEKEGYVLKLVNNTGIPISKTGYPKLKLALGL
jgi:two-component system, LytTR family, response regulator